MQTFANIQVDANSYTNGVSRGSNADDYLFNMYAPDTPGTYKVIVFSHGIGGSPSAAAELAAEWTAKGYIVLAPAHPDSPDSLVGYLASGLTDRARWEFRANDVKIALDIAEAFQINPGGGPIPNGYSFDTSAPVVAGHSFGGNMAAIIAGAQPTFDGVTYDWSDNRFEAAIALSGSGAEGNGAPFETDSFDTIDIPFLRITGGYDFSPETADPGDRMDGIFRNMTNPDVHGVFIPTASHMSVAKASDNLFGLDPDPQASFDAVLLATSRFLDAYIDGDTGALAALDASTVTTSQVGTDSANTVTLTSGADIYFARAGADNVTGGDGDDQLYGMNGADTLVGGNGADLLNGGAGNDVMQGGAGDDFYVVNSTSDTVTEGSGAGTDTVFADITYTLAANVENLILSQSDILGAGDPALNGTGNGLANVLNGNSRENTLSGVGGADTLNGGDGDDVLIGGAGTDTLNGEAGNDLFDFDSTADSASGSGRDIILAFDGVGSATGDLIDVSTIDARTNIGGNQAFSFIGTAAFTASGQVRVVDSGADVILQFNTNANTVTVEMEILIQGIANPASLTAADFIL
jgi:Ca2+-binding RTX toxin-like protein